MENFNKFVFTLVSLVLQIFSVGACPARCIPNGGACNFQQPTKCCSPICLAQYGICGKVCANINSSCMVTNDCCNPLICEKNVCCALLPQGSTCNLDSDCCSKSCDSSKGCCTANGQTCNTDSECCLNSCTNNLCCSPRATICKLNSECCSQTCGLSSPAGTYCV